MVESNKVFSRRLKSLREEKNLTQAELAMEMNNFFDYDNVYKVSTISAWEARGIAPKRKRLSELAKFFDVTEPFLLGISSDPQYMELVHEYKYLTISELEILAGECVWILTNPRQNAGKYAIVSVTHRGVICENGELIKFEKLENKCI